jgi:hypothetical protein
MNIEPLDNCIFKVYDITQDKYTCILLKYWRCHTDATVCGDLCPDYEPEGRQ